MHGLFPVSFHTFGNILLVSEAAEDYNQNLLAFFGAIARKHHRLSGLPRSVAVVARGLVEAVPERKPGSS